ncbi:MAG: hypothetical protein AAFR21_00610 [Pseudomonadota bacterium]
MSLRPILLAVSLTAFPHVANAEMRATTNTNALVDFLVAEDEKSLTLAFLCVSDCSARQDELNRTLIDGVSTDFFIDLSGRNKMLDSIRLTNEQQGYSVLTVMSGVQLTVDPLKTCETRFGNAACVQVRALDDEVSAIATERAPALAEGESLPIIGSLRPIPESASPNPESSGELLSEPERFVPPSDLARPKAVTPVVGSSNDARASLRTVSTVPTVQAEQDGIATRAAAIVAASFDLRTEIETILGRPFTNTSCQEANQLLQEDAWALNAMVELAFCKAIDGDLIGAEQDFSRLLTYTPDNYEALVGRALLESEKGNVTGAVAFFQDALDALPPIEESDRIVAAMNRL